MEKELIEQLEKLGWRLGYLGGHGDTEAVHKQVEGETLVIGDIEKSRVLIPPEAVWEDPIKYSNYY
jgi:hypothetical protein